MKALTERFLGVKVQTGEHSSVQDSQAALRLYTMFRKDWEAAREAKRLRNLKKKLRNIEALEAKLSSGEIENPEPKLLEKVARKTEVMKEINALEKLIPS